MGIETIEHYLNRVSEIEDANEAIQIGNDFTDLGQDLFEAEVDMVGHKFNDLLNVFKQLCADEGDTTKEKKQIVVQLGALISLVGVDKASAFLTEDLENKLVRGAFNHALVSLLVTRPISTMSESPWHQMGRLLLD